MHIARDWAGVQIGWWLRCDKWHIPYIHIVVQIHSTSLQWTRRTCDEVRVRYCERVRWYYSREMRPGQNWAGVRMEWRQRCDQWPVICHTFTTVSTVICYRKQHRKTQKNIGDMESVGQWVYQYVRGMMCIHMSADERSLAWQCHDITPWFIRPKNT